MANPGADETVTDSLTGFLRRAFSKGLIISLPLLITVVVFIFVVNFVAGLLDPAVIVLRETVGAAEGLPDLVNAGLALAILTLLVLLVGISAESGPGNGRLEHGLESAMEDVPGLGSVYTSVEEISEMVIDSDTESFREVKVIEYPSEGTYALGFLTAGSTGVVGDATGEDEMVTVFVPMAPNPMGGFLIHVPTDRAYDVDLTVEEGIQTVLSTGVTLEDEDVEDLESGEGDERTAGPEQT